MKNYFLDRLEEKERLRKIAKKDANAAKRLFDLTGEKVEIEIDIPDYLLPSNIDVNVPPSINIPLPTFPSITVPNFFWPPTSVAPIPPQP